MAPFLIEKYLEKGKYGVIKGVLDFEQESSTSFPSRCILEKIINLKFLNVFNLIYNQTG